MLLLPLMGCGSVKRMEKRRVESATCVNSTVIDSVTEKRVRELYRDWLHDYTVRRTELVYDTAVDQETGRPRVLREIRTDVTGNVREREMSRDSVEVQRVVTERRDSTANVREVTESTKERKRTCGVWWLIVGVAMLLCVYRVYKFLK